MLVGSSVQDGSVSAICCEKISSYEIDTEPLSSDFFIDCQDVKVSEVVEAEQSQQIVPSEIIFQPNCSNEGNVNCFENKGNFSLKFDPMLIEINIL